MAKTHFKGTRTPEEIEAGAKLLEEAKRRDLDDWYAERARITKRHTNTLPESEWDITFDSLKKTDDNKQAIARMSKWSPSLTRGAVICGSVGTGKSSLCKALINKLASPEYKCLFITVGQSLQNLRDTMDDHSTSTLEQEFSKLVKPALLVLDDLGAEKKSEWGVEQVFNLIEARTVSGKHTFYTSNLNPKELEAYYGPRIKDRLVAQSVWIKLSGPSWRAKTYEQEW